MAEDLKPVIEESQEESKVEESAEINVDAVMQELEAIGKTKPEEIRGMYQASQSTGRYANEIGELRQEIQRLRSERTAPQQPPYPEPEYGEGPPIDLKKVVKESVGEFWQDIQRQNNEMYQRQMQEMNAIYADEDYPLVKQVWEEHTKTPNFNMRINSGQTSPQREYDKVVRSYYRAVAKRSKEALEVVSKKGGSVKPPHIEAGSPPSPDREEGDSPRDALRKIASKSAGQDADIDKMVETLLPEGDVIYRA